ncbi:OmpA family protein [Pelagibacteraceae bacterium]|nr:OmpA family protein [Pelagibacteraceae bacterium]
MACSVAYEQVKEIDINNPKTFHEHLFYNYQQNASYEAEEMHDWNSAKLYSKKALKAFEGQNVYPEKINYWKISDPKTREIKLGYNNLLSIYEDALNIDPKNLAKAISALDCWAEQEEEKWQKWDIKKCKNNFHLAMHNIYNLLSTKKFEDKIKNKKLLEKETTKNNLTIVTENHKKEIMQMIYFDFDDFTLSEVSKNTLENFLNKNMKNLSRYIIIGHADTKGDNNYNFKLSLKRAEVVKEFLLNIGIAKKNISILGKGENNLAVHTPDNTKHPANRRAEVKILN